MKKIILATVLLASCSKDRTCTCNITATTSTGMVSHTNTITKYHGKKKDCKSYTKTTSDMDYAKGGGNYSVTEEYACFVY